MNELRIPRFPPVPLQPSRWLAAILITAHAAISGLLLMLPLPAWIVAGAVMLLLASAAHSVYRYALLRGRSAITALAFDDRETIAVGLRDGGWHAGRVLGTSTVGATLTILNIVFDGRRLPVPVVLLADSLDANDFRRLRVWLRWGPRPPAEEPVVP